MYIINCKAYIQNDSYNSSEIVNALFPNNISYFKFHKISQKTVILFECKSKLPVAKTLKMSFIKIFLPAHCC